MIADVKSLTKLEVDALSECIDLTRNGYVYVGKIECCNSIKMFFRHPKNHRRLNVIIEKQKYCILEGNKVIKSVAI